ncbi:conjugative transfer relaxase/helicase TraI (plasmid) [Pectobacteriaceae bacterium CE70]|nr:conjugative transfer relaxase/helicase TraI [Prodigiosinella sp. LS101]WJV60616.1 conjugative transfer relaxase/helicase TraI [Pectobacteriaceae bacterium C111]WJV64912.1 conjugative transfer relaxase/helicase TraI [Pectobacteriaceae bacterium C52]WJV69155.1 conjugative transfer relaxase/helicase TraI [Pectobacteriaceae bacterium CE70]WJY13147.1 conjugative transfer relaxase/helicase TraI [Pectobacteriaceae bacterium C80]WJY17379.1 conjugative transfer relaxase/helicase TraI [Pectobacteriac
MMTVASVASAADAAGYYSSKDNYYFLDDLQSQWLGEGARELGLEGNVDLEAFTNVLHGRLPNGVELGKEVSGNHVHRPGHDFTFSAPKSVSMLILAGGDKRLLQAHIESVKETLAIMEQTISARDTKEGITSIVPTGKMVAALFTHDTSRNLDPAIHTHAVVANVTELDGKWKALATDAIYGAGFIETMYRHQVSFGKIYRNSLKAKAETLGYETELTGGKHELWEIKGFPEAVLEEFSSRHREIAAQVGDEASLKSRDVAALDTRQKKVDISRYGLDEADAQGARTPAAPSLTPADTASGPSLSPERLDLPSLPAAEVSKSSAGPVHTPAEVVNLAEPEKEKTEKDADEQGTPAEPPIAKPETQAGRNRLQARWDQQMADLNFDIREVIDAAQVRAVEPEPAEERPLPPGVMQAVRTAISVLSDTRTRFTYGDLLMTAHEVGEAQQSIPNLRKAIDRAIVENLLAPLDGDKGVFTSHIHLLDELSVQALATDIVKEGKVVSFRQPDHETPERLKAVEFAPVAILNAPASIGRLREVSEELVTMSREHGREVKILASSAERGLSFGKSPLLKDDILYRSRVLDKGFSLSPHSTLIVESAERLGLKEMLVLSGEAKEKDAQLIFLDSAGRQSNANALSVLSSAGVPRHGLTEPVAGLEARVISIGDKRDRYRALAERYADLSSPDATVTAVVTGAREQQHLTGIIRDALQNAGKLERDGVTVEARTPVYASVKERLLPATYRAGMVLEDRSDKNETRHYTLDRVHEEARMLSLIDSDGVLSRVKLSDLTGDWRLFTREQLHVAQGEQLFALAADKANGLKARDRLTVTAVSEGKLTVQRDGQKKPLQVATGRPLYLTHGYVSAPGSRDNEHGIVLASLNARDLSGNIMNALAQSGHEAEIFTGEAQNKAEEKLGRMRTTRSPLALVRQASGKEDTGEALAALNSGLLTDAQKAVSRAVAQMKEVAFSEVKLLEQAGTFFNHLGALQAEVARQVKEGDLIPVKVGGGGGFVGRATWEMEKTIIREIDAGKNTQTPLMATMDPVLLNGLTAGQKAATTLILQSPDRFTAVQGYAGVGKTTQFRAVKAAIDTLPESERPLVIGLAPTHRAVKEMRDVGIEAQTLKSFVVDWQQRTAAGEDVRYTKTLFLIDESSMLGNQDTAAAYQAISRGEGRAVPVGDTGQLQSPESGAPFTLMQERSAIDVAVMNEIVRQRNHDLKSAVYSVIENKAGAALEKIEQVSPTTVPRMGNTVSSAGSVIETDSPVPAIIRDYMSRTPDARERTMIVVQLHEDRQAINTGIHQAMVDEKVLGDKAITVPILDRITGGRHDFNRINDWKAGQVVLANERYLSVTGVDKGTDRVFLRDENDRMHYYSPAELNVTEIEVFERREIELREGDSVRMSKTQKQAGHDAHEQYRIETLRDNGEVVLKNAGGEKVITPGRTLADQHIDYAWAVTGYGAQGASTDYVIALEGTDGARKRMSGMRAFYINASRARDHVQIYTDGLRDWMDTLRKKDNGPTTAHDALTPESERSQARSIWAMGQPVGKTAIGRTYLREQGLKENPVTARIIPPTRKYPMPHLALPVYDGNGKTAGLTMFPLQSDTGQIQTGPVRQLTTEGAQAAVVQKSRNGDTIVVSDMTQALAAARGNPAAGVLLLTGRQMPSAQLLKVAGGVTDRTVRPDATLLRLVQSELQEILRYLPAEERPADESALLRQALRAIEETRHPPSEIQLPESKGQDVPALSAQLVERVVQNMQQEIPVLPGEKLPDYAALIRQASGLLVQNEALQDNNGAIRAVLATLAGAGQFASAVLPAENAQGSLVSAEALRYVQAEQDKAHGTAKNPQNDLSERALASAARELEKQGQLTLPPESRGREPEREEITHEAVRNIQKER